MVAEVLIRDAPIIFHTGLGGLGGLLGPAVALPAGAAFASGSAMLDTGRGGGWRLGPEAKNFGQSGIESEPGSS